MIEKLVSIAEKAGHEIMAIYPEDPGVDYKADNSPLTRADKASHAIIISELERSFPQVPIVSEEGHIPDYSERASFESFWLVDPLDGTKEFVKKNGEFTVNIALIRGHEPVLGVVHIPAQGLTYTAEKGAGAFRHKQGESAVKLAANQWRTGETIRASVSRSHPSEKLKSLFENLGQVSTVPLGSALKFCKVAEGEVDLYPRLGPTMEWDTAAAQLVAEEAGALVRTPSGEPFRYNKESLLNGEFIVAASPDLMARALAAVYHSG